VEEVDGGDSGGAEDEALPDEFPKLVASHYGANTPTSKGKRRASLNAKGVWANIKRIKKKVSARCWWRTATATFERWRRATLTCACSAGGGSSSRGLERP